MKKILLMMIAGSFLFFGSCVKSGPVGPQGPQGPQGNANVYGTEPFTVSSWAHPNNGTASGDLSSYYASFTDADITTAVADRGSVEIFLYYPEDKTWKNLPDIYGGTQFSFRFSQGGFEIYFTNVDGSNPSFPGTYTFRAVAIAPAFKEAHPNTNWKNYNEAMAALNSKAAAPSATQ